MEDVRPELEIETPAPTEVKSEMQVAAEKYSRLCHDAGQLQFQIKEMQGDLENLFIQMRNARVDYLKAKKTTAHVQEVTKTEGVTQ